MKKISIIFILLGVLLFAFNVLGQKTDNSPNREEMRRNMREKMHQKMMDKLLFDQSDDQWFDQMDQLMDHALKDMDSLFKDQQRSLHLSTSQAFDSVWEENSTGRTLKIKPSNKNQPLDIEIVGGFITIKGKSEAKNSLSQFSSSINVPRDCDEAKVKMDTNKEGDILVFFPYKKGVTPKVIPTPSNKKLDEKQERIPIKPTQEDIEV